MTQPPCKLVLEQMGHPQSPLPSAAVTCVSFIRTLDWGSSRCTGAVLLQDVLDRPRPDAAYCSGSGVLELISRKAAAGTTGKGQAEWLGIAFFR